MFAEIARHPALDQMRMLEIADGFYRLRSLGSHTPLTLEPLMPRQTRPNILFIMSDDIGWFNASCYNNGIMGYRTPNIDRIAKEGALFTDFYGQQSCTAGRAAFITGQAPIRTGLTKVGMPGAKVGLSGDDPTIAAFQAYRG